MSLVKDCFISRISHLFRIVSCSHTDRSWVRCWKVRENQCRTSIVSITFIRPYAEDWTGWNADDAFTNRRRIGSKTEGDAFGEIEESGGIVYGRVGQQHKLRIGRWRARGMAIDGPERGESNVLMATRYSPSEIQHCRCHMQPSDDVRS
jgi:hypothetical protein